MSNFFLERFFLTSLTSLISPTSKCLTSELPASAGINVPVDPAPTGVHREEMVPVPNPLSVIKKVIKNY